MHKHVTDSGDAVPDIVLHVMGDLVRALHGHLGIHFHMKINIELMSHFSRAALFDPFHAGSFGGDASDALDYFPVGRAVHQFIDGRTQEAPAVPGNYCRRADRGDVVCAFITFAAGQSHHNAESGSQGRNGIAPVVPRISLHRGALERDRFMMHKSEQPLFHRNDSDQYYQRK